MVSKKRINRPKLYFRVILAKDHFLKDHFSLSFYSSLFLWFSNSLSSFFSIFVLFLLILFFNGVSSTSLGTSNFSNLPSSIRHSHTYNPLEKYILPFPPSVRGDPWLGYLKEIIRLKGETIDNFLKDDERWPFFISNTAT